MFFINQNVFIYEEPIALINTAKVISHDNDDYITVKTSDGHEYDFEKSENYIISALDRKIYYLFTSRTEIEDYVLSKSKFQEMMSVIEDGFDKMWRRKNINSYTIDRMYNDFFPEKIDELNWKIKDKKYTAYQRCDTHLTVYEIEESGNLWIVSVGASASFANTHHGIEINYQSTVTSLSKAKELAVHYGNEILTRIAHDLL
jgi:hypothetical protein